MAAPAIIPVHPKLKDIRERKDLKLRSTKHLKDTFTDFDGQEKPLNVRYYQVQGILHLVVMPRFILGDDTGLGKCKPLDSLVLTDTGLVRLGDLAPKGVDLEPDTFYNLDHPVKVWTGWKWAPIKRFYYCGTKPTKKIKTQRGYETSGSFRHPLWVRNSVGEHFTRMDDLKIGDHACLDRYQGGFPTQEPTLPMPDCTGMGGNTVRFPVPSQLTPSLASLLGYIVAEGWTNTRTGICITQHQNLNPETHADIVRLCKELGWDCAKVDSQGVSISSVYIRAYLQGLGIDECLAAGKTIPWPIFAASRDSVAAFLRAFFDSEGSFGGCVTEVTSASETMLREIQVLLLRFGIMSSRIPKLVKGYDHTYWRLNLCGEDTRSFQKNIGFLTPRKQGSLVQMSVKPNANLDVIPHSKDLIENLRSEILAHTSKDGPNANRKGSGLKQFGTSFQNTLNNIRNYGRNPTYPFLQRMLEMALGVGISPTHEAFAEVRGVIDHNFFYDPIVSIEDGIEELADIEVDDPQHSFVADGFINHNTLMSIAALCYLWEKDPNQKAIILTTKSASMQWLKEFSKFTKGVKVILSRGSPKQREQAREMFTSATGPTVLISGYRSAIQDFTHYQNLKDYVLILDEATAFKNHKTQVHQVCRHLSNQAARVWGLTATLIKNNLMEGWGIYQVVVPGLFGHSYNSFMLYFAITRMQRIPRSNRQIPLVVGYYPEKIAEFRQVIDPFFIGRPKHIVASELPSLTSQYVEVEMSTEQEDKYQEALNGLLAMGDTHDATVKEVTKLTAIAYCQEIVNDLGLIGCAGGSPKLDALIEILTEGDLADEKVIVFSRFEKMVSIIMQRLRDEKVKAVRVTGAENDDQRDLAKAQFQDPNSDVRVICITTAGSEAINLQAAKALVCYDTPWSAGDFLQLLGRMIRIGSVHDRVFVIHLMARGKRKKTIDHRVMDVLAGKMTLVEAVLGKRIKGEGEMGIIEVENDISDLFASLKADAREGQ